MNLTDGHPQALSFAARMRHRPALQDLEKALPGVRVTNFPLDGGVKNQSDTEKDFEAESFSCLRCAKLLIFRSSRFTSASR